MLYSSSRAAKLAGVSLATLRNLTTGQFAAHYAGLFSAGAAPGKGAPRVFTDGDVRLLAFVASRTRAGASHADVAADIHAGALDGFTWSPADAPTEDDTPSQDQASGASPAAALAVLGQFAEAMRTEFAAARQHEAELQAQVIDAERRAAMAEARAAALESQLAQVAQPRGFLARLFGR